MLADFIFDVLIGRMPQCKLFREAVIKSTKRELLYPALMLKSANTGQNISSPPTSAPRIRLQKGVVLPVMSDLARITDSPSVYNSNSCIRRQSAQKDI